MDGNRGRQGCVKNASSSSELIHTAFICQSVDWPVSRTRGATQPSRVNPVDSFEAVEETDNQFTKTKRTVPRANIGQV